MTRRTMGVISYGLRTPADLLAKLKHDAEMLSPTPHPFGVFNFIVTASVVYEWIVKFYDRDPMVVAIREAVTGKRETTMPAAVSQWVTDLGGLRNEPGDLCVHVVNLIQICVNTSNASKHYHWEKGAVTSIATEPIVEDWYQYFFTSTAPDLYIEGNGQTYGLSQIKTVLLQFYEGLISHLDSRNGASLR
jgi:hypothetical protein